MLGCGNRVIGEGCKVIIFTVERGFRALGYLLWLVSERSRLYVIQVLIIYESLVAIP